MSGLDVLLPLPAGPPPHLDVSTDVFAGPHHLRPLACPLIPLASTKTLTGRLVRPLVVFEAPRVRQVSFPVAMQWQDSTKLDISHSLVVVQLAMRVLSVGEDGPGEARFAGGGIDTNEWDSDECLRPGRPQGSAASGSTRDGPGAIQERRRGPRFEHEDFMGPEQRLRENTGLEPAV